MGDRNFKPDSGEDLVFEDAGSTDRLRITDGGSTILYEDNGNAALTIDTDGNVEITNDIEQTTGKQIHTSEIRAKDGDGLKLYDDGGAGIFVEDGGKVGIGTTDPDTELHVYQGELRVQQTSGDARIRIIPENNSNAIITLGDSVDLNNGMISYQNASNVADDIMQFDVGNNIRVTILGDGKVGIGTTSPGQILDCNSGSGNMIADGYDTHSLAVYKENIEDASGYLDKVLACPAQKWNPKPFISADEIKEAVLEEFSETVWKEYFPEDNSHRQKALYNMPEGELKTWIDNWCEVKRVEMRPEAKWQKKRLGLVADAELTAEYLPEVISINDEGEPTGIDTMTYIGILHNALTELSAKVNALENA